MDYPGKIVERVVEKTTSLKSIKSFGSKNIQFTSGFHTLYMLQELLEKLMAFFFNIVKENCAKSKKTIDSNLYECLYHSRNKTCNFSYHCGYDYVERDIPKVSPKTKTARIKNY